MLLLLLQSFEVSDSAVELLINVVALGGFGGDGEKGRVGDEERKRGAEEINADMTVVEENNSSYQSLVVSHWVGYNGRV